MRVIATSIVTAIVIVVRVAMTIVIVVRYMLK